MIITKDRGTTVVEVTKEELQRYDLSFCEMDCSSIHIKRKIANILCDALGKDNKSLKEIILFPHTDEGCVIVCKEREQRSVDAVSFSSSLVQSEIFCSFFS